jgi:methylglutaconyl-CoA hydratase
MELHYITYSSENRIATITLNRPEKRNALHPDLVTEMLYVLDLAVVDEQVKIVLLKANGEAFCAGADLGYLQQLLNHTYEENLADSMHLKSLFEKIYFLPKVVIAQIEGSAIAGGCGLATVCDFAFTVPEAKFGFTEVRIGFIPAIVMIFLLRKCGEAKSKELLLTGNLISAEEAVQFGFINKVIAVANIQTEVAAFIQNLLKNASTESLAITKKMIANVPSLSIIDALNYAAEQNAKARAGADCKKGISGFINKEKISW